MKNLIVLIMLVLLLASVLGANALVLKQTTWGFKAVTGMQIGGFPTSIPPTIPTIKPVCKDTDASPDYGAIGIPAPEVQQKYADLFIRGQATGFLQSGALPQIVGEDANKCAQRALAPNAGYSTFMDCCADSNILTESFCKGNTGPLSIQIKCKNGCKDGMCVKAPACTDTDGGKVFIVQGITTAYDGYRKADYCHNPGITTACSGPDCYLSEHYCTEGQMVGEDNIVCPYGCKDGACVKAPAQQCTDTDGGKVFIVQGITTAYDGYRKADYCHNPGITTACSGPDCYLSEHYCTEGQMVGEDNIVCSVGCQDGACVMPVVPQPPVVQPPVVPKPIAERVTCMFKGTTQAQKCYSDKGECSGRLRCNVAIAGTAGEKVLWKSTCGGYANTTIDGVNEAAVFACVRQR